MNDEKGRIKVEISQISVVKTVLTLTFFVLLFILRDLVVVVLVSVIIASAIEPMTRALIRREVPRVLSVVFIYLILALLLIGAFYYLLLPLLNESANFLLNLPNYLNSVEVWNPLNKSLGEDTTSLFQGISQNFSVSEILVEIRGLLSGTSDSFVATLSYIFGGMLSFFLIIVLSFYLAVQEDGVGDFLRIITPIQHEEYVINLWKRAEAKMGLWLQGQVLLAVIVGVLVYLGLTLLGVSHALLYAFLAMILEVIPIFGPIIAGIPALSTAYLEGGITLSIIVVCLYTIIQQFESNLIYPVVVRKIVGVPPIMVILSLIIGFKLFGFLGVIIAVPVAAVCMEFLKDWERKKIGKIQVVPEVISE